MAHFLKTIDHSIERLHFYMHDVKVAEVYTTHAQYFVNNCCDLSVSHKQSSSNFLYPFMKVNFDQCACGSSTTVENKPYHVPHV